MFIIHYENISNFYTFKLVLIKNISKIFYYFKAYKNTFFYLQCFVQYTKSGPPVRLGTNCDGGGGRGGQLALVEQLLQKIKEEVWDSMLLLLLLLLLGFNVVLVLVRARRIMCMSCCKEKSWMRAYLHFFNSVRLAVSLEHFTAFERAP